MNYYTLFVYDNYGWEPAYGSYEKQDVIDEYDVYLAAFSHETLRIVFHEDTHDPRDLAQDLELPPINNFKTRK